MANAWVCPACEYEAPMLTEDSTCFYGPRCPQCGAWVSFDVDRGVVTPADVADAVLPEVMGDA